MNAVASYDISNDQGTEELSSEVFDPEAEVEPIESKKESVSADYEEAIPERVLEIKTKDTGTEESRSEDVEPVVTEKEESKSEDVERDESKVIDGDESKSEDVDREESKSEVIDKEESRSEFIDREESQSGDVEKEESKSVVVVREDSNLEDAEVKELNSKNIGGELALQSERQNLELEYIEEAEVVCPSEPIKEKDVETKTVLRGSEDSDGVSDVSDWIAGERPSAEHNKGDTVSHQNNTDQVDGDEGYSQPDTSHTICQEQDKTHIENNDTLDDDGSLGESKQISFGSGRINVRFFLLRSHIFLFLIEHSICSEMHVQIKN